MKNGEIEKIAQLFALADHTAANTNIFVVDNK